MVRPKWLIFVTSQNRISQMRQIFVTFIILGLLSCSTSKNVLDDDEVFIYEERFLDTMTVSAPRVGSENEYALPKYNPSFKRVHDLIHTKLEIAFDWEQQHVLGKADLAFKTLRETNALWLDAKGFDIHAIKLNGKAVDKHFNDGKGQDKDTPQQIWTQGETENNSRWFPTIDKPNERCTQEIYLTVDKKFQTLSNGLLISSKENSDGTRTDYWKQDLPHAPYLFMLGIGEFAVVEEKWKGKDLLYYVEEEYRPFAKEIFAHTPEMLSFFSDLLNYPYPWDKYAQMITREYVSGAMENTTAVIFGDFVQKTDRELIDNDNDFIVAHEMRSSIE